MPSDYIGKNRSTAVYQLIGLVYLFTLYPIALTIGLVGGALFMLTDVIMGLFLDRKLSAGDSTVTSWEMRLFMWPLDQLKWIATGDGSFPFLP